MQTPSPNKTEEAEQKGVGAAAGDWLIIRNWQISAYPIEKVTPKLFKLGRGAAGWGGPRTIAHDDRKIVCTVSDRETAERLTQSIAGIDGEYKRRCKLADADHKARCDAARAARDKSVATAVAALSLALGESK